MTSPAPEGQAPPRERSPLLRRLVPLALIALGLVLWRSPLFPQPRTFVWDRPFGLSIVSAEVQLWRGDTLLARAEWPDATQGTLSQQLSLRTGPIRVLSFVRLGNGIERRATQDLNLGSEDVVHAPLLPAGR
ncbi:MAG TPA: hypothetical protein VFN91_16690 [Myxococcaceae bacterium]|nr:hypothetical protein [Myxococcaceae bacterium]